MERELDTAGLNQRYKRTIRETRIEEKSLAGIQLRIKRYALKDIPLPLTTSKADPYEATAMQDTDILFMYLIFFI